MSEVTTSKLRRQSEIRNPKCETFEVSILLHPPEAASRIISPKPAVRSQQIPHTGAILRILIGPLWAQTQSGVYKSVHLGRYWPICNMWVQLSPVFFVPNRVSRHVNT